MVDELGEDVPEGTPGEIVSRGSELFLGYTCSGSAFGEGAPAARSCPRRPAAQAVRALCTRSRRRGAAVEDLVHLGPGVPPLALLFSIPLLPE